MQVSWHRGPGTFAQ
jgi:hypothetical protein